MDSSPADSETQSVWVAELLGEDLALRGEAQRELGDVLLALLAPGVARLGALDVGDPRALCGLELPGRRLRISTPNESMLHTSQTRRSRRGTCVLRGAGSPQDASFGGVRRRADGARGAGLVRFSGWHTGFEIPFGVGALILPMTLAAGGLVSLLASVSSAMGAT